MRVQTAAADTDHHAFKGLQTLAIAFFHLDLDDERVARAEARHVAAHLLVFELRDDLVLALLLLRSPGRRLGITGDDLIEQTPLFGVQRPRRDQVGAPGPGSGQRLFETPFTNPAVVAGKQHPRHTLSINLLGPRVMRVIEETRCKGIRLRRPFVSEHARPKPGNGIDYHHRGQLAPGEHVVSDGPFFIDVALEYALVNAFVAPGQQDQVIARREFGYACLIESTTLR